MYENKLVKFPFLYIYKSLFQGSETLKVAMYMSSLQLTFLLLIRQSSCQCAGKLGRLQFVPGEPIKTAMNRQLLIQA